MQMSKATDPWTYAAAAGRDYVTPEDIGDAARHISGDTEGGHSELDDLWEIVLKAIGSKRAEDPSLCAFVAAKAIEMVPERWYA